MVRITGPLQASSVIYIHAGDFDFPEAGWRDFVFVLLDAWSTAVLELDQAATATFMFMDGPFNVQLTRDGSIVWASFTRGTFDKSVVEHELTIRLDTLQTVLEVARRTAAGLLNVS